MCNFARYSKEVIGNINLVDNRVISIDNKDLKRGKVT